ncbi:TonB-dependent receptor [Sphingomonas carotinifaciens]|uniref:TonB-dependent receptor n=1 Tax=Sphingomonas carotinifaciens TaxID=1166323 RepID=A0A1G7RYH9_9SPHN|nr:TonB-dependent receptor [Sphingomonas carotinifaciens]MBB4088148.1 TonB-dependent receptor [Sphingomonas carotinifaciens]MWC44721.1 TonB-dependent receptor [Sphingomonas carotinifaciens]SDG14860.1 TonB-dependent receptor [Sphingomonas carotinifaciens]
MFRFMLLTSAAAVALCPMPSFAQSSSADTRAATTKDDASIEDQAPLAQDRSVANAEGRSPGVEATQNIDQPVDAADIVITGYRASLGTAQQIKRNSDAILDAVVAQDIGKLPDNTAAESLARITGVQVTRGSDEVTGVLVRGLPNVATTFNGRDIFTAELRRSQLQDFPAGVLAGLEVYKSGTADLLEPGLAGLVNVRSNRPFDFSEKFVVAGGIRGTYNDQSKKYDPLGNILVSARSDTALGEIGVLVNASYAQAQYRNAVRWASGFVPTELPAGVTVSPASVGRAFRIPERVGVYNDSGKRWRPAVNASVQWKPADNLEVYYDFLFQGFRGRLANDLFETSLINNNAQLSNVVLRDGVPDQVQTLTKTGGERGQAFRSTVNNNTNTYQSAGGLKWNVGRARISTDLAYTRSQYDASEYSFDMSQSSPTRVDVNFFTNGGSAFDLPGYDRENAANYRWRGYFESLYVAKGAGWQWRGDVELDTDVSLFPRLQIGARWTDRDASLERGNRYAYTETLNIPLADTPAGALALTPDAFRGNVQGWTSWLMPSRQGIEGNAAALREFSRQALIRIVAANPNDGGYRDSLNRFSVPNVQLDPFQAFYAKEQTYAFYGQAKYEFDIGSFSFDGLVGARAVNTVGQYTGRGTLPVVVNGVVQTDANGIPITAAQDVQVRQNFIDVLPNVSLRIRPTDKLQIRFGFTKTRTVPDFGQLNPAFSITPNQSPRPGTVITNPDGTTTVVTQPANDPRFSAGLQGRPDYFGSGGNPNLAPLTSNNFDATIEYYFSRNASITAAFFYRDLFGFFNNYVQRFRDPVYGLVEVNRPLNAGAGRIRGVEVGGQTFLDFLPGLLSGFGVQANATYLDGQQRFPVDLIPASELPPFVAIPSLSKWSYNAALFYEKGTVSTRLSYNGRSRFLNGNLVVDGVYSGEGTENITRLDFSFNYTPIKQITLTLDAANLLAQPFRNYAQYAVNGESRFYPRDVRDEGRYYGIGARFRF